MKGAGSQSFAHYGKMGIRPVPMSSFTELVQRAAVGPVPGELMLLGSVLSSGGWVAVASVTDILDRARPGQRSHGIAMG